MPQISNPLCTRRIHSVRRARKQTATVTIGHPVRRGRDWACQFHVSNIGMAKAMSAWGVDGLQALTLALEGIRVTLQATGERWSWLGMRAVPRLVPEIFGMILDRRFDDYIDAEIEKFSKAAAKRATTKRKAASRAR